MGRRITFSTILWMLERNIPLGHCEQYTEETIEADPRSFGGSGGKLNSKQVEEFARVIVNALSQHRVGDLVAEEWELFGPALRMRITDLCNSGWRSGNVQKGILYLDKLLGGKVLSRRVVEEERVLVERGGAYGVSFRKKASSAVVGAERAFAAYFLPSGYHTWSPARKKQWRAERARERREAK